MVKEITLVAKKEGGNYPIGVTCSGCGEWTPRFEIDLKTGKAYCPLCLAEGKVKEKNLFFQGTYALELNPEL